MKVMFGLLSLFAITILVGISVSDAYAADTVITPPDSAVFGDHHVSITRADTTGTTTGTFLNERGLDGIVYRIGGNPVYGEGFEVLRIDNTGKAIFGSGKAVAWENNQVSIGRTDTAGTIAGGFLNLRGAEGIVYRIGGADTPGAGFEVLRIDDQGTVKLFIGKSMVWSNHQVGISRTDTTGGVASGGFMTLRGAEGYIFKVVGADVAGDGVEIARIDIGGNVGIGTNTPAQKLDVNGNIKLTGVGRTITSDGDICIGAC